MKNIREDVSVSPERMEVLKHLIKSSSQLVEYLNVLKKNCDIIRLGKLFTTEIGYYFYDSGTGKVVQFDKSIYSILHRFFHEDLYTLPKDILSNSEMNEFFRVAVNEHLFQVPDVNMLYERGYYEGLPDQLNNNVQQIILELTGRCNLRCGYCVYNESYVENRAFNSEDMSWETAKAAIDYLALHGADEVAIGFYGGEPLLKYNLMKNCIEYAKTTLSNKHVTYSFTTNCTLVTNEMAKYFSTVDGIAIMCSIDGPKDIHNEYRKDIHGGGSFDLAIKGLKTLFTAFEGKPIDRKKFSISINGVFTPPYTIEKATSIYDFFQGLEWLPKTVNIQLEPAREGSIKVKNDSLENESLTENPMWSLGKNLYFTGKLPAKDDLKGRMYMSSVQSSLATIHKRFITDIPLPNYPFNGCCVPGARRLYISTSGKLYLCERIENSPSIGDIHTGIDIETIRTKYVTEYSARSIEKCRKCWAIRLCRVCYAECYNENGMDPAEKRPVCFAANKGLEASLALYHQLLEQYPEKLNELNDLVIV